ncbi:MAG: hypothetical protein ABH879_03540 [archaeon]
MQRLIYYLLAGILSLSSAKAGAESPLDRIVQKAYVHEKGDEWRDHLWSSAFLTLSDSFLLQHADYEGEPENLAAQTRFAETVAYQGIYTPLVEGKITPVYAAFDIAGTQIAHKLFPKLGFVEPFVDRIADITERKNLRFLALVTAGTMAAGYTLPRQRDLIEIDAGEQTNPNNAWLHVGFFAYYTFRTSMLLEHAGYDKHPPESLAWRVAFGLGLAKELIYDGTVGKGPSVIDAGADALGVWIGHKAAKVYREGRNLTVSLVPNLRITYTF